MQSDLITATLDRVTFLTLASQFEAGEPEASVEAIMQVFAQYFAEDDAPNDFNVELKGEAITFTLKHEDTPALQIVPE